MSSLDNSIRQINPIHAAILMVLAQFTGWCAAGDRRPASTPLGGPRRGKEACVRRERYSRSV